VPLVLDAIKARLNRSTDPGAFVITGSTRYDALPLAAQSLTGRLHILTILPLSQGELLGHHETFLENLLGDADNTIATAIAAPPPEPRGSSTSSACTPVDFRWLSRGLQTQRGTDGSTITSD